LDEGNKSKQTRNPCTEQIKKYCYTFFLSQQEMFDKRKEKEKQHPQYCSIMEEFWQAVLG
jgi:hypothetical protein